VKAGQTPDEGLNLVPKDGQPKSNGVAANITSLDSIAHSLSVKRYSDYSAIQNNAFLSVQVDFRISQAIHTYSGVNDLTFL
jgi:hypothetical protein